jgi:chromosomal replication initiation ATPase DnaA
VPAIKSFAKYPDLSAIKEAAEKMVNKQRLAKSMAIYLMRKITPASLKDIAGIYKDISDAGVSAAYKRMENKVGENLELAALADKVKAAVKVRVEKR